MKNDTVVEIVLNNNGRGFENSENLMIENVTTSEEIPKPKKRLNYKKYVTRIQEFRIKRSKVINNILFGCFNIVAVIYFIFASIFEYNNGDKCITEDCRTKWCGGYGTLLIIYVIFYLACFYCYLFKPYIAGFLIKLWGKIMKKHGKWLKM